MAIHVSGPYWLESYSTLTIGVHKWTAILGGMVTPPDPDVTLIYEADNGCIC